MGELIRSMDWSRTPLGPFDAWPQSLRTTVSLCLSSTFPILIAWGPDRIQIYNDAYRPICGELHPRSMGQAFNECWESALPAVGHVLDRAQAGTGSYIENLQMFLDRYGYLEEAFMTFSFSPIRDESGGVGGLFHPITEVTDKMLAQRRNEALREIGGRLATAKSIEQIGQLLVASDHALDLPFLQFYLLDDGIPLSPWPLDGVEPRDVDVLENLGGPFPEGPAKAMVLPIQPPGATAPIAVVVAGVSVRRALDPAYVVFYEQLRAVVTSAAATVLAYEQEQARAAALAELNLAKTTFFSNVSHEFRTPLTLILGPLAPILASANLSTDERAELERVQRNARRLLKLVNTLLDFSRLEAGRLEATFEPVDLASLTRDLASSFRSLVETAGLALVVDCAELAGPVHVDRGMYEKIVLNLLSNAFKFTFDGEVRVTLRTEGEHAVLSVSDTGTGIAAGELPRVFERFHRVQGARGRSYEGSGIGLALVQELVKLHQGEIAATSTVGKGTTFVVRLPLGLVNAVGASSTLTSTALGATPFVEEAASWAGESSSPAPSSQRQGILGHVLLADDNADMRAYVQSLLAKRFTVEAVADGVEALAAARARVPDVILSDVMMPNLDGFGLLRALRADQRTANVPVVLLSARAGEEATVEGIAAGANDYLVKPFSAQELVARVESNVRAGLARQDLEAFAGRIAHDIRNLLAPLPLIAMRVAKAGGDLGSTSERLERITRRSSDLLDGLLAFSKAGRGQVEEGTSSPAVVVPAVVDDLESLRKEIDATVTVGPLPGALVSLPRGLFHIVVLNLVQNALKFLRRRPVREVTITFDCDEQACTLSVADTGPGIPAAVVAHVFEPFYRAPGTKGEGHGIGLATVDRIVRAADGTVSLRSVEGEGTRFDVTLPRSRC